MTKFNLDTELENLECPEMFKKGLIFYIETKKLKISNSKDFEKLVDEYKDLKIGA